MSTAGKELCDCGKTATWYYTPGYSGGGNPNHCDECVPRGCECNHYSTKVEDYQPPGDVDCEPIEPGPDDEPVRWLNDHVWTHLDEMGREYPCCEYTYSKDGWEIEEDQ